MKTVNSARRDFLLQIGGAAGAAWISAQWPEMLAAAQHAHSAAKANPAPAFEVLTPDQAIEIEAISSLIIPTDELPGAREAGVVYFIDRALKTFAEDAKPAYDKGLADLNHLASEMFPGVERFSAATPDQQEKLFAKLEEESQTGHGTSRRRFSSSGMDFARDDPVPHDCRFPGGPGRGRQPGLRRLESDWAGSRAQLFAAVRLL